MNREDLRILPDLDIFQAEGEGVEKKPPKEKERRDLGVGSISISCSIEPMVRGRSLSNNIGVIGLLTLLFNGSVTSVEPSEECVLTEPPSIRVGTS